MEGLYAGIFFIASAPHLKDDPPEFSATPSLAIWISQVLRSPAQPVALSSRERAISIVREALAIPGVRLLSIKRAPAYALQHHFLTVLTLPEGAIDLRANLPPRETALLAPATTLVVGDQFHPALAELLLSLARQFHGEAGLFEQAGDFPSRKFLDFPISNAAKRFFDSGPSFLQRYLPFWAADLIDRLKIILLPLITLVYPMFKLVPPTYDWRMRSRINRWYKDLQTIEEEIEAREPNADLSPKLDELDRLEAS